MSSTNTSSTPGLNTDVVAALTHEQLRAVLPAMVADWVDLVGVRAALALVRARPGFQIKVPLGQRPSEAAAQLVELMGADEAAAFMARHGGEQITVPRCARALTALRNAEIVAQYSAGVKVWELCVTYGLGERQLRDVLSQPALVNMTARAPARRGQLGDGNPAQVTLFDCGIDDDGLDVGGTP